MWDVMKLKFGPIKKNETKQFGWLEESLKDFYDITLTSFFFFSFFDEEIGVFSYFNRFGAIIGGKKKKRIKSLSQKIDLRLLMLFSL